ncbi:MAG TPA: LytTR family DNA-binding domain-containing protein [Terracidiphilus sp.]|nr:LytTR family DNA-binding domain-containing protein [Terracidiphilus sp.]
MIRTLLIDDEALALRKLRRLLADEPEVQVVGEASSAPEAFEAIKGFAPQLLFLDVRLPGMGGMELIDRIADDPKIELPQIIFTTAYDHYALRAFELRAVDYLLKPFTAERLHSAIERARDQMKVPCRSSTKPRAAHSQAGNRDSYTARIVFKSRGRILFLPVTDIRWIGAEENYVRICTEKESHLLRETMTGIEQKLDPQMFLRVHRSAIVNLQFVKEVRTESQGDFVVHLVNGQRVSMSRSYHSRLGDLLARA